MTKSYGPIGYAAAEERYICSDIAIIMETRQTFDFNRNPQLFTALADDRCIKVLAPVYSASWELPDIRIARPQYQDSPFVVKNNGVGAQLARVELHHNVVGNLDHGKEE